MGLTLLLGVFAGGVIIGLPVAFTLGIAALAAFWYEGLPLLIAFQRIISGVNVFSLLAIPFFIFAGELMFHGGIAMRLVQFASAAVGSIRRGCRRARPLRLPCLSTIRVASARNSALRRTDQILSRASRAAARWSTTGNG